MRKSLRRFTSTHMVSGVAVPVAVAMLLVAVPAAGARPGRAASGAAPSSAQQRLTAISGKERLERRLEPVQEVLREVIVGRVTGM